MTKSLPTAAQPALTALLDAFDSFIGAEGLLIDQDGTLCRAYSRLIEIEKTAETRANLEIMTVYDD